MYISFTTTTLQMHLVVYIPTLSEKNNVNRRRRREWTTCSLIGGKIYWNGIKKNIYKNIVFFIIKLTRTIFDFWHYFIWYTQHIYVSYTLIYTKLYTRYAMINYIYTTLTESIIKLSTFLLGFLIFGYNVTLYINM